MATVALACMVKVHKMCRNRQSHLIAISMVVCGSRCLPGVLWGPRGVQWGMGHGSGVRQCAHVLCVSRGWGRGGEADRNKAWLGLATVLGKATRWHPPEPWQNPGLWLARAVAWVWAGAASRHPY